MANQAKSEYHCNACGHVSRSASEADAHNDTVHGDE
jgi:hypothetical protein